MVFLSGNEGAEIARMIEQSTRKHKASKKGLKAHQKRADKLWGDITKDHMTLPPEDEQCPSATSGEKADDTMGNDCSYHGVPDEYNLDPTFGNPEHNSETQQWEDPVTRFEATHGPLNEYAAPEDPLQSLDLFSSYQPDGFTSPDLHAGDQGFSPEQTGNWGNTEPSPEGGELSNAWENVETIDYGEGFSGFYKWSTEQERERARLRREADADLELDKWTKKDHKRKITRKERKMEAKKARETEAKQSLKQSVPNAALPPTPDSLGSPSGKGAGVKSLADQVVKRIASRVFDVPEETRRLEALRATQRAKEVKVYYDKTGKETWDLAGEFGQLLQTVGYDTEVLMRFKQKFDAIKVRGADLEE